MSADFSQFVRIVARGPNLGRSLSLDEAQTAMGMILDGKVEPEQIGALLMVLRFRTETAEELAGFVQAARKRVEIQQQFAVDLDWPSYADAHKQLPYFLLAAKLLGQNDVRVVMHGIAGSGTATTRAALNALGTPIASNAASIHRHLEATGFAYVPLESLCPSLAHIFELKSKLGLRSCVHTAARELNPFQAVAQIQGVFHPTYLKLHRETQALLHQTAAITFKGSGGEGQRNPCKPLLGLVRQDGNNFDMHWPCKGRGDNYPWRDEPMDVARVRDLWNGAFDAEAPRCAVIGTAAICLWLLGRAATPELAENMAEAMWRERAPLPLAV